MWVQKIAPKVRELELAANLGLDVILTPKDSHYLARCLTIMAETLDNDMRRAREATATTGGSK